MSAPNEKLPPKALTRREKLDAFENSFEIDRTDPEAWIVSCKLDDCPRSWEIEPIDPKASSPALALGKGELAALNQHVRAHTGGGSRMRRLS